VGHHLDWDFNPKTGELYEDLFSFGRLSAGHGRFGGRSDGEMDVRNAGAPGTARSHVDFESVRQHADRHDSGGRGGEVEISDGKVSGDDISFNVVREFQGNSITTKYKGKVSGDSIDLTIEGPRGGPQTVTAKKST
jgi:hypothetical protein